MPLRPLVYIYIYIYNTNVIEREREQALPGGFMGAIETCKRAFAISRKRICVAAPRFQTGRIDRTDLEQNVPPVTRLYENSSRCYYGVLARRVVAFVVGRYLLVAAIGSTPESTMLTGEIPRSSYRGNNIRTCRIKCGRFYRQEGETPRTRIQTTLTLNHGKYHVSC